ncbi:MAG: toll/interleukin-1 receptor domain-containing protein [Pseudomonadota bacterium]
MADTTAEQPGGIFISYRRVDGGFQARALHTALEEAFPDVDVFMDIEGIELGVDFVEVIEGQIACCRVMVVVINDKWLEAAGRDGRRRLDDPLDFVRVEIRTGLQRGIRVIPVLVGGVNMPRMADLPDDIATLSRRQGASLSFERFTSDMALIIKGVASALKKAPTPPEPVDEAATMAGVLAASADHSRSPEVLKLLKQTGFNFPAIAEAAFAEIQAGRYRTALGLTAAALEQSDHAEDDEKAALAWIALRNGEAMLNLGDAAGSEAAFRKIADEAGSDDEKNALALVSRFYRGRALIDSGRAVEAEAAWRELLPLEEEVKGARHPDTLTTRASIARAMLDQGRAAEAEAAWGALLPLREEVAGARHPHTLTTRFSIARAMLDQGRAAEAEAACGALLPLYEEVKGARHPGTLIVASALAGVRARLGDLAGARAAAPALGTLEEVLGAETPRLGLRLVELGEVAAAEGDAAGAAALFDRAERIWDGKLVDDAWERRRLAEARARWGVGADAPGEG